jgi:hypothetical protein
MLDGSAEDAAHAMWRRAGGTVACRNAGEKATDGASAPAQLGCVDCSEPTFGRSVEYELSTSRSMGTLDDALNQFEAAEANLVKLESLWGRIEQLVPTAPAFGAPPEYEELCRAFRQVLPGLPAIDGFRVSDHLYDYDAAGQMLLDAAELGEIEASVSVQNALEEQGRQLRDYRFRLLAKRRALVRGRLTQLMRSIDDLLVRLMPLTEPEERSERVTDPAWDQLKETVGEIETLIGSGTRPIRWGDLRRHIHFGMVQDLLDIVKMDWPAVKTSLASQMYGQHDPVPVTADDLGELVSANPTGSAHTQLDWPTLNDENFERLLFQLISEAKGYENPEWLQKTHAPDRGRDLSVVRVEQDNLGVVRRYRTIIQCKHWLSRSVGPGDISDARAQMELWQPPRVDVLVVATTGRFTADAIALIEQHNQSDRALRIEMWPDSHLERLLASRPHLIGQFRLRRG